MGRYELIRYPSGAVTVKHPSGEAMHSSIGPWEEATLLYADQSRLSERLLDGNTEPLTVWDVGMGIAANALCAIEAAKTAAARAARPSRPLRLISFENDLEGLRFALANHEAFPWLAPHRATLTALLRDRHWQGAGVDWQLLEGPFGERVGEAPPPSVVFWDFYAPKTCPELWTPDAFAAVKNAADRGPGTEIYTYSSATPVRVALLLAGFFVGIGRSTPLKTETTVASTHADRLESPLGREWLGRFDRSERRLPYAWANQPEREAEVIARVRAHPQFQSFSTG